MNYYADRRRDYPTEQQLLMAYEHLEGRWFISPRTLARKMKISTYTAGYILRDFFKLKRWNKTKKNNSRNTYIVPEEYRK